MANEAGLETGILIYLGRVYLFSPVVGQLGHGVMAGTFGAGLGLAVWSRSWIGKILFPLLGLGAAMFMHAVHNGLTSLMLVLGFGLNATAEALTVAQDAAQDLPMEMESVAGVGTLLTMILNYVFAALFFLGIWLWTRYQRRVIREELTEEVDTGLVDRKEWELAPRYLHRLLLYWRLLWSGKVEQLRVSRRLDDEVVDLALLKRRARSTSDWEQVERIRRRIEVLKAQEVVELVDEAADASTELP